MYNRTFEMATPSTDMSTSTSTSPGFNLLLVMDMLEETGKASDTIIESTLLIRDMVVEALNLTEDIKQKVMRLQRLLKLSEEQLADQAVINHLR